MSEHSILICGLPGSGKTTFLGALSYLMTSDEIPTLLSHNGLPKERTFLNKLANRWCQCEPMERTRPGDNETVRLKFAAQKERIQIDFPDLAGETWHQLWRQHLCSEELAKLANEANSVIVFIHADDIRRPLSVVRAQTMANALGGANTDESTAQHTEQQTEDDTQHTEWNAVEHCPTQAIKVSLLQQLARQPMGKKRNKVAIVLSAWDQVSTCTPEDFVSKELPLLYQYLNSGFDYNYWKAFGVSAQGGHLSNSTDQLDDKEKLLNISQPSERIIVQDRESRTSDLTTILNWAIELE